MKKPTSIVSVFIATMLLITACDNDVNSSVLSSEETKPTTSVHEITTTTAIAPSSVVSENVSSEETTAVTEEVLDNDLPDICSSRYGYYKLNADEKAVYDQIFNAISSFKPNVTLTRKLQKEKIQNICKLIKLEENGLYYFGESNVHFNISTEIVSSIDFSYTFTQTEVQQLNTAVNEKIKELFNQIPENTTEIAKIKIFHDKIALNCNYSLTYNYNATPYGALVAGEALCEGYARAFAILCNKAGIENCFATGTYKAPGTDKDENHIWNMVKLDGNWYNIDVTWDDPLYNGNDKNPDYYIQYNNFLYKTNQSGVNLIVDESLYTIPETTSSSYNYFIYYGYYAKDYDQAKQILSSQINNALQTGKKYIRIKFATDELYNEAQIKLFDQKEIFDPTITPENSVNKYPTYRFDTLRIIQLEVCPDTN